MQGKGGTDRSKQVNTTGVWKAFQQGNASGAEAAGGVEYDANYQAEEQSLLLAVLESMKTEKQDDFRRQLVGERREGEAVVVADQRGPRAGGHVLRSRVEGHCRGCWRWC